HHGIIPGTVGCLLTRIYRWSNPQQVERASAGDIRGRHRNVSRSVSERSTRIQRIRWPECRMPRNHVVAIIRAPRICKLGDDARRRTFSKEGLPLLNHRRLTYIAQWICAGSRRLHINVVKLSPYPTPASYSTTKTKLRPTLDYAVRN